MRLKGKLRGAAESARERQGLMRLRGKYQGAAGSTRGRLEAFRWGGHGRIVRLGLLWLEW
jgi:hypothetical protein